MKSKEIMPFVMVYRFDELDPEYILKVVKSTQQDELDPMGPMCFDEEMVAPDRSKIVFSNWEEWFDFGMLTNVNHKPNNDGDVDPDHLKAVRMVYDAIQKSYESYIDRWVDSEEYKYHNEFICGNNSPYPKMFGNLVKHWDINFDALGNDANEGWVDTTIAFVKYVNDYKQDYILPFHIDDGVGEEDAGPHAVLSSLVYLNDDYDEGVVSFLNEFNDTVFEYKPKAGDVLVFPSYRPIFHSAAPSVGNNKYFARHFLTWRSPGTKAWQEQCEEFGKDQWLRMRSMVRKLENEAGFYTRQVVSDHVGYKSFDIQKTGLAFFAKGKIVVDSDW